MKKLILTFSILLFVFNSICFSQWNLMNLGGGTTGPIISSKPGTLFAATGLGIYRSTNSALTWQNVCDTSVASFWRSYPTVMVGRGDTIIFGSYGHVISMARLYITTNNGTTWRKFDQGVRVSSLIYKDNCWLYSCTRSGSTSGLYRSTDVGTTWTYLGNPYNIKDLFLYNNYIYGMGTYGTFRSSDYGTSWDTVSVQQVSNPVVMGNVLAGSGYNTFYKSTNSGYNWETLPLPFNDVRNMVCNKGVLFVSNAWDYSTYRSIDTGKTWTKLNTLGNELSSYCVSGNTIYGAYDGVLRSTDNGLNWTRRNTGLTAITVGKVFADGRNIYAATSSGLSISRNYGTTWTDPYAFKLPESWTGTGFAKAGVNLFFATDSLVYRTSNSGVNWTEVFQSYYNSTPVIASNGTNVFLFYYSDGMMYSSNAGNNWTNIPYPISNVYKLAATGSTLICGGDSGLYKTTNLGQNWTKLNDGYFNATVRDFEVLNSNWYAATDLGIFKSSDNGLSWLSTNSIIPYSSTYDIQAAGNNLYYTTFTKTIYVTTNSGLNWTQLSDEAGNRIFSITANTSYVYCGTSAYQQNGDHTSGVYRHNLSIITNVQNISEIPSTFRLFQNYPNPFNPVTTISFDVPKVSLVKISVYDITGREVSVIVNENMQAGSYERQWDGSSFSSGVYFYKITAGDFVQSKKMLLIK